MELRKLKRFSKVGALGLIILLFSGIFPVQAADTRSLIIGFGDSETPPFKSQEKGKYVGIFFDVVQEVMSRTDINIEGKPYPYNRLLLHLQNGHLDGAIGVFKTSEREQFAEYVETPIAWTSMRIFVRKGHEFSFGEIRDLSGKRIGKVRGISISKEFDQALQQRTFSVEETTTYKQSINKLQEGRIDALVAPMLSAQLHLARMGVAQEILMLPHPVAPPRPLYFLFSKAANFPEKAAMFEEIRRVLRDMEQEKKFEQIMKRYEIQVTQ